MRCASDRLHGVFTEGKDWNELLDMIVEAIYCQKRGTAGYGCVYAL